MDMNQQTLTLISFAILGTTWACIAAHLNEVYVVRARNGQ